jgi:hypothetical protein
VGLFHKDHQPDIWTDGVKTTALIERVQRTGVDQETSSDYYLNHEVYVVFRLKDGDGAEVIVQRDLLCGWTPQPGATVDVAYLPGQLETTLDYDHHHRREPDPAVPRGWGAGFFQPGPIGQYGPFMTSPDLDAERTLFINGPRADAEIIEVAYGKLPHQSALKCTMTLRVDGNALQKEFWADPDFVPKAGDHVQIAISADRTLIALDTDERYFAPPGRSVVWSTPAAVLERRDNPNSSAAQIEYFEKQHAAGKLSDAQFAAMKRQLGVTD